MNLAQAVKDGIERLRGVDSVAKRLQDVVGKAVPQESRLKDLLSGTWIGEPLHPPLTDVVVGSWTSAVLLDLVGGEETEDASRKLIGIGVLAAVPTAASGASDWAELGDEVRRVGIVHAAGNTTALSLFALSYLARRNGSVVAGRTLSALGFATAMLSAYLGGYLTYGRGVGVNQTAFEQLPDEWTPVLGEADVEEETPVRAAVDGVGVVVTKSDGRIHALVDRCNHRGCSLADGTVEDGNIRCPCHGSRFRLDDGSIVSGPATDAQPVLDVRMRDGKVEVRARGNG